MSKRLSTLRNRVGSVTQTVRREVPQAAVFASFLAVALERLGARAPATRRRRMSLLVVAATMMMVRPAAAQANCNQGVLGFLSELQEITIEGAGLILFALIAAAAILKALPLRGTDRAGNMVIGGVIVGIIFFVVGPAIVDIAATFSPIDMAQSCTVGG